MSNNSNEFREVVDNELVEYEGVTSCDLCITNKQNMNTIVSFMNQQQVKMKALEDNMASLGGTVAILQNELATLKQLIYYNQQNR